LAPPSSLPIEAQRLGSSYAPAMNGWNLVVWAQMDAAIATLRNAIEACTDETWRAACGTGEIWRAAFHATFFLDLYSGDLGNEYAPPAPFDRSELQENGVPERVYAQGEVLAFLEHARANARARIAAFTDADAERPATIDWLARRGITNAEAVLYNLRHVQHHAAQINLVLRQAADHGAAWVSRG
jgi:uncharacterized damage-inducible protein DinB